MGWNERFDFEGVSRSPYCQEDLAPVNFTDPSGEIPLLAVAALAWGATELALTAWDAVSTAGTLLDDCASGGSN